MTHPDSDDYAVLQALVVRASQGKVSASFRTLASQTGLSRQAVARATQRLMETKQLSLVGTANGPNPPIWAVTQPRNRAHPATDQVADQVARDAEGAAGNRVPTMPFQLLPLRGSSSWFEQVYRQLTRALGDPQADVACRRCGDTGYRLERTTEEYTRDWLQVCECPAGEGKTIPDLGEYIPPAEADSCLMCGNSGWVTVGTQVQRCYSCRRTWGRL